MTDDGFELKPNDAHRRVGPREPLYTMLCAAPLASVEYLYAELSKFSSDAALGEQMNEVGLTRRAYLEQVLLVLEQRRA